MFKDYYECRIWLENFIPQVWTRKELGLERISHLLELLGNPQNKFKSIHIAGTSGKGSTAFYIAKLLEYAGPVSHFPPASAQSSQPSESSRSSEPLDLRAVGSPSMTATRYPSTVNRKPLTFKIGLHISPHLIDIRERLQINGKLIPMNRFIKLIGEIKPTVESMKDSKVGSPSYFEILVAAAFLYFAKVKVDWAVVEVGLGGRLDATNVLNPQLTVITNVGLDHTDVLGKTEEKIAVEKAGIIKLNVPIVTGCPSASSGSSTVGKALKVIEKVAKEKNAPLITINTQSFEKALKSDVFSTINLPIDIFRSTSYSFTYSHKLLALAAVKTLEIPLSRGQITKAFGSTFPGRFEEIENGVILDGAHNADKVRFLIRWIKEKTTDYRLQTTAVDRRQWTVVLIIAFKKGKDWKKMIDLLVKNLPVSKVIVTKFYAVTDMGKHQAVEPKEIAKYVRSVYRLQTTVYSNSHEAVFASLQSKIYNPKSTILLVTGSLYLVGEVRAIWQLPQY